ncbi:MAG: hypothetical protein H7Z13_12295 [Ferruginibacter sp.]|nr:hypothetical protein [Ferruginibacter sp.]
MKLKKIHTTFLVIAIAAANVASAQLFIDNATFLIETGATVTVQGDITSNVSIQGAGKVLLKGTSLQNVNMNNGGAATNAYTIPNLEIDNTANVVLTGNCKVGTSLLFTNGKVQLGNFNFLLDAATTVAGAADNKFLETNGTGFAQRNIGNAAAANQVLPVGAGTRYTPISLTHAGGTYASALLGAQAKTGKSPNSHPRVESYANVYWPVATTGVTGGTFSGTGTYPPDAAPGFTGTEADIRAMGYNGTNWSLTGETHDFTANTLTAQVGANAGQIFGMNRFLLMNSKVLLQGANPVGGVMSDGLRAAPSVIPTTEPYRGAPFNFTSLNGGVQEVVPASVFNDLGTNNNIVDWVYLELRNNVTTGSVLLQTRSAFVQKDGDIVDVDGTSPLYFKNLDAGDYTVTVRHRNHMAISTNNTVGFYKNLTLSSSTPVLDFASPATNVLGVANTNYVQTGGFNMMYAGNANFNTIVNYSALGNDRLYLLNTILSGTSTGSVPGYSVGDLNMNKIANYSALGNDRLYLLNTVLAGSSVSSKNQVLPN